MNYTQQFNQEFDRVYKLIFGEEWSKRSDFNTLLIFDKIRILHEIFTAKNEKGEPILKQADLPNPLAEELLEKEPKGAIHTGVITGKLINLPKTLRDLFLANCIPSNDPEQDKIKIENLKIINW